MKKLDKTLVKFSSLVLFYVAHGHIKYVYTIKITQQFRWFVVALIVIFILMAHEQAHSHGHSPWKEGCIPLYRV